MKWLKAWVEHKDAPVLWGVGEQRFDQLTSNYVHWGFPFSLIKKEESDESPSGRHEEINRVISNWAWRAERPLDVISAQALSEQARLAGRQALTAQHIESAEQLFTLSLDLVPESHRAWSDMAILRFGKGDIKGAASAAKLAIQLRPDLANPRFSLIKALHTLGDHIAVIDAVSSVESLGVQGPKLHRARLLGAQSHMELGQVGEALILLRYNLLENPDDAESLARVKALRP
jgi:tetratricopeptide (TPR) repeat protein